MYKVRSDLDKEYLYLVDLARKTLNDKYILAAIHIGEYLALLKDIIEVVNAEEYPEYIEEGIGELLDNCNYIIRSK